MKRSQCRDCYDKNFQLCVNSKKYRPFITTSEYKMQLRKGLYTSTRGSRLFCFKSLACFRYILDGSTHIRAKNIRFFKITKCILYLHHNKTFQQFQQIMLTFCPQLSTFNFFFVLFLDFLSMFYFLHLSVQNASPLPNGKSKALKLFPWYPF